MPSLKEPIKKPNIPISDDPEAISWLTNWLNNRRQQLFNNYDQYQYGSKVTNYSKPKNKNKGDIRDDGFDSNYVDVGWNPLHYLRGDNPDRITTNKIFYNLINNAASAPQHVLNSDEKSSNFSTRGMYVEPNNWNNTGHYIVYPGTPDNGTNIHERTHAMNPRHQEVYIRNLIDESKYNDKYLDNEKEIYGRLMQYRFKNNLNPKQVIDENYLNKNKDKLKEMNLDRYDNNTLIRLFNEVAQNKINNRLSLETINLI